MENDKKSPSESESDRKIALHYFETLVDVAREGFLILDDDLRVISANTVFYKSFHVSAKQTRDVLLYKLGNGQWDIPELKKLLEEILPKKKAVRDYKVTHRFETIGEKTIILNARQIDSSRLIILAMEDITIREELVRKLTKRIERLETKGTKQAIDLTEQIRELEALNKTMVGREIKMIELKKEIADLKTKKSG